MSKVKAAHFFYFYSIIFTVLLQKKELSQLRVSGITIPSIWQRSFSKASAVASSSSGSSSPVGTESGLGLSDKQLSEEHSSPAPCCCRYRWCSTRNCSSEETQHTQVSEFDLFERWFNNYFKVACCHSTMTIQILSNSTFHCRRSFLPFSPLSRRVQQRCLEKNNISAEDEERLYICIWESTKQLIIPYTTGLGVGLHLFLERSKQSIRRWT